MLGLPALGAAVGILVAAAVTLLMTPTYEAESSVILIPDANLATGQLSINEVNLALSLTTTTADLAESSDVAASVASTLGLPFESVFGHVDGQSTLGLQLVTIEATADSAQQAADIANAVAREVATVAGELSLGGATIRVEALDSATPPSGPVSPRVMLNLALGAMIGALAGIVVLAVRRHLDGSFTRLADVEAQLGLPVLGGFIVGRRSRRRGDLALYTTEPEIAQGIERLTASLSVLAPAVEGRRIVVCGIVPGAEMGLVPALVATAVGADRRDVVVVDATGADGESNPPSRWLSGFTAVDVATLLDSGDDGASATPRIVALADDDSTGALIDTLQRSHEVVVIAPAVLAGGGLARLAEHADVLVLGLDSDETSSNEAGRAALLVRRLDVALTGIVVVGAAADNDGWVASAWPEVDRRG
jgi:capsular polysaccharide biosynthesis protein